MAELKVFKMNDCDWYAAENVEDAKRAMAEWNGYAPTPEGIAKMCEEFIVKPVELSAQEMEAERYWLDEAADSPTISFRERLAEMIADGDEFPSFFASTPLTQKVILSLNG